MKQFFLDLETTGLDPAKHAVWQLSGYVHVDGIEQERFDFKVQPLPGKLISQEAMEKTGMDIATLKTFDPPSIVYPKLKKILKRHVDPFDKEDKFFLFAYNASFDMSFLRQWFEDLGDKYFGSWFYFPPIDVMQLAAHHLMGNRSQMKNFKLATVASELGIAIKEELLHDAFYDIELTRLVYNLIGREGSSNV